MPKSDPNDPKVMNKSYVTEYLSSESANSANTARSHVTCTSSAASGVAPLYQYKHKLPSRLVLLVMSAALVSVELGRLHWTQGTDSVIDDGCTGTYTIHYVRGVCG